MLPATWRSVLGTVLAHGFTSLLDCIKASQVRTVFRAGVIDYQHAPLSLEIGRRLSDVDDTLIKRLAEDPTRPCGPETSGITVVWPDGSKHTPVFTDRNIANPGCWTDEDVAIALEERRRGAVYTATDQAEAAQRLIGREFYSSSAGLIGNDMRPTAADALAKAMERIAKGRLVNEKGEATIGVDDIKVLLDMKERCPGSE
jgi:hypothetical protein